MSADTNGISNYDLLQELHEARVEQSTGLTRLEAIVQNGFTSVATELQELRKVFQNGFLKTINIFFGEEAEALYKQLTTIKV